MKTGNLVLKGLLLFVLMLVGCSSEVTREVPITVEITREVEVTREVPVTVEVEVEVIKEVPVTVTCTPESEDTPEPTSSVTLASLPGTEVTTLRSYRIYIGLPLDYTEDTSRDYPVIYLLDGNYYFFEATQISRMNSLFDIAEIPPVIIVGIGYLTDDFDQVDSRRRWDLLSTNDPYIYDGGGGAGPFLRFIREQLIPYIDANYRTDPEDRAIAGHSAGGNFALYALFHATDTFQRYLALSPSINYDDNVLLEYEEEFAGSHSELPVELFLSVGSAEWYQTRSSLEEFYATMQERNYAGLEMELVIMEGTNHLSCFPGAFSRGLKAVFHSFW